MFFRKCFSGNVFFRKCFSGNVLQEMFFRKCFSGNVLHERRLLLGLIPLGPLFLQASNFVPIYQSLGCREITRGKTNIRGKHLENSLHFLTIVFLLLEVGGSAEIEEVEHLVLPQVRRGPEVPDLQERFQLKPGCPVDSH